MDSQDIIYTAGSTPTIPILPNQNLQTILQNIDTAINSHNTAPNYSGYNLGPYSGYTVTQVDSTSHPTNTQNFAEGISKIVCVTEYNLYTFTGTTYPTDQLVITDAINGLSLPILTYTPFSITTADTVTQVWNKTFTGLTAITASIVPTSANWSTWSISSPTTIVGAFNAVITHGSGQDTAIASKEATIGTFNNSANCLAGTSTDTPRQTIAALTTYCCALPTLNTGSVTWLGVTTGTNLQTSVQNLVNSVSGVMHSYVSGASIGLTISSVSGYTGQTLAVDTTWPGLYKVAVDGSDTTPANLYSKLTAGTGITLTIQNVSGNENIKISSTEVDSNEVLVSVGDSTPGYLVNKLPSTTNTDWGLTLNATMSIDQSQLLLTPGLQSSTFAQRLLSYISTTPELFTQFQQLVNQTEGGSCATPTLLSVTLSSGNFVLTWTPSGSASSQNAKYRMRGNSIWTTTPNLSPVNPLSGSATTSTLTGNAFTNVPMQFTIDSICTGGGIGTSNLYEMILYTSTSSVFSYSVSSGVISVNQDPLPGIDTIQYRLRNSAPTVIQNISATGLSPNASFTSVASGTYSIQYRFGTLINGSTLYSSDSTEIGDWITISSVVVP